jgi:hypothetical protein
MRQRQKGVTFIGWLFLLIPIGLLLYCAIRLTPIYLNYMSVSKAINQVASSHKGEDQINPTTVRGELQRYWDVDSINYPEVKAVSVTREGDMWQIEANYEDEVHLFGNISLVVHFEKKTMVQ